MFVSYSSENSHHNLTLTIELNTFFDVFDVSYSSNLVPSMLILKLPITLSATLLEPTILNYFQNLKLSTILPSL